MTDSTELHRPWTLFATTALVFAGCLWWVMAATAHFAAWRNSWIPLGMTVLASVAVATQQYRATFRYNTRGANVLSAWLSWIAMMLAGWGVLGIYYGTGRGMVREWGAAWILSFAVLHAVAAWGNFSWWRQLRCAEAQGVSLDRGTRFSLRELFLGMATLSILAGGMRYTIHTTTPRFAEHVSAAQAPVSLPEGAHDISYCQDDRGQLAYEFMCDEIAFVEWVKQGVGALGSPSATSTLLPIRGSWMIQRYHCVRRNGGGNYGGTINDGLYLMTGDANRGVMAAYDRATGRGYCYDYSR